MTRENHPLFEKYPLDGQVVVAGEALTTPYHIHDGAMLFVGGTADAETASALLAGERLTPLLDTRGRALAAVWIGDFTEANLGPHLELQISLFAAFKPLPPLAAHPFAIFRALTAVPETRMVCHGLWNSTPRVVRYNAEHLQLDAHLALGGIERGERWRFRFADEAGNPLATGDLAVAAKQQAAVSWALLRHIGWRGIWRMARSPFFTLPVVNTRSRFAADNRLAWTHTRADRQALRYFAAPDRLSLDCPRYAALDFAPAFVHLLDGLRFVYLRPQDETAASVELPT